MKSVGIEIGTSAVRISEIEYSNRKYAFTHYEEHALNLSVGRDTSLEIIEILRRVAKNYPEGTRITLAIGQEKITSRFKTFPFRERQKIYKSLPFELEDETPFTIEDAIFESKIVRYFGNGANVLAFACPKAVIDEQLGFAKDVGILPSLLSSDGVALSNLVDRWWESPPESDESLQPFVMDSDADEEEEDSDDEAEDEDASLKPGLKLIVHIGHRKTLLTLCDQQGAIAVNTMMWGSHYPIRKITDEYEIPYPEALKEFTEKAFILLAKADCSPEQIKFSELVSASFGQFVKLLKRTLLEWQSDFNQPIREILLTGEGASVENLGPFLTTQLEVPANRFNYLEKLQEVKKELTEAETRSAAVSIGLAIEGHKRPRNPAVDFLKDEYAVKSERFQAVWQRWGYAAKMAAALFVIFTLYSVVNDMLSQSLSDAGYQNMVAQGKVVMGRGGNAAKIKSHIKQQKKVVQVQKKLSGLLDMNSGLDVLNAVNGSFPQRGNLDIEIKKFDIKYKKLRIEGLVNGPNDVKTVENSLKKLATGKLTTEQPTIDAGERTAFAFSLLVDRNVRRK